MIAEDIMSGVKSGFASSTVMSILAGGFACMVACFRSQKLNCVNMIYSREYHCIHERHTQDDKQLNRSYRSLVRNKSLIWGTIDVYRSDNRGKCQGDLQLMYRSKTMERQPSREGLEMQTIQIREVRAFKRDGANQTKGKSDRHLINRSILSSLIAPSTFVPVRSLGSSF